MRLLSLILFALALLMNLNAQTPEQFVEIWEKEHVSKILPSDVHHADLKKYLEQLKKIGVAVNEVGRSHANREIYQAEWGIGPIKLFMWSQMHGDEPTATSALIDMFAFLQNNRNQDWVKTIRETMTIRAVPMLNPDGSELYQRRNLQGIDINRDAIELRTPEAQLLKKLRDDWNPSIGFNLHNQNRLTTVGPSVNQASISLLAVFGDAERTVTPGHERNQRVLAAIAVALQKFLPGHIGRYSDEWTPSAFGDNFSAWGTPTILIETGGLHGKDEMFLVKMNFVAFMTALHSLATGSEKTHDTSPYLFLLENRSGSLFDIIFRQANVIRKGANGAAPVADIAVNTERRRASFFAPNLIKIIGDLPHLHGLDEYDASGFNVVQRFGEMNAGSLAEFYFYRKDRVVDWTVAEIEKQFPPDAVFSGGKWIKGEKVVAKK